MHRSQIFFYLIIAFLAGVFMASLTGWGTNLALGLFLFGVMTVAVTGYHKTFSRSKNSQLKRQIGIVVGAALLVAGFGVVRYNSFALDHGVLETFAQHQVKQQGIPVTLHGYVAEEETISSTGRGQVVFNATSLVSGDRSIPTNERTLIITNPYPQYEVGQKISVAGKLDMPQNFNDFDYVKYLKTKGVRTTMSFPKISGDPQLVLRFEDRLKVGLYNKLFKFKNTFESAINNSVPQPYAAYINGVLLGSRQNIPQGIVEAFNKTGTTHILAISGYNITIIAEALLGVLVLLMRRQKAFWVSVVAIVLFTIMTGASSSVVRAAIMGLLLLSANGYGRLYNPRNSILLAAGIMVWFNPFVLYSDIGFQLSFLAVLGLMYVYPILEQRTAKWSKVFGLKDTLLMTLSAQVLVVPLLIYYFHQFSLVSLPTNVLVLPLMPLTMLFGFLAGVGGMILVPLGQAIGLFAWALAYYQIHVIQWFASLPFSSLML